MTTKDDLHRKYFNEKNKAIAYKHEINRLTDNLAELAQSYIIRGRELALAKNKLVRAYCVTCVILIILISLLGV